MSSENLRIADSLWVLKTAAGYKIGLTNAAQEELGKISFVTMPKVGKEIKRGDSLIELEAEKSVSDFSTPISGKIALINEAVEQNPSVLDHEDQKEAWIAVLTDVNEEDFNCL